EFRFLAGGFTELGPATAWMRLRYPLVAGEQPAPLERVLAAADSGNGISGVLDFRRHLFVNTDLTVTLSRPPVGEWICLDSTTHADASGSGMTDTALYDRRGRIGRATQALVIAER
nr:thioesterase family protein [Thermoleophilaceae bacterium]